LCKYISVFSRVENYCQSVSDVVIISMLTDQRLESFVDRSQQFWSAARSGNLDMPRANDT